VREPDPEPPVVEPPPQIEPPPPVRMKSRSPQSWWQEPPETGIEVPDARLRATTRRDFLLFTAGAIASAAGAWWLLPDGTRRRMLPEGVRGALDGLVGGAGLTRERRERVLDGVLRFDDDVAEALYSPNRRVRTYRRSDITPLKNNYHGHTPGPGILEGWALRVSGLAGGATRRFTVADLLARFPFREQITRLVCVEGWSAVSWWGGIAFADLVSAFPPAPGARWAALRSEVSLDPYGRPEPYYVAIDLGTAIHSQTLLVTHHLGRPLTLPHGAPLRLIAPVKLGLKNIKAITDIAWVTDPPPDYWAERGYSYFDGL
jgi:DMSO/TMAO reductase YedYZ molybdopterin-dependent catalytic subunit